MSNLADKILYIIVPCYNEENVLPITSKVFICKLQYLINKFNLSKNSQILYVNDGSTDSTWNTIKDLSRMNKSVRGISLSRNMGHQNALLAGLYEAKEKCDICISIDCDGQDDINAMDEMLKKYDEGNEIVYGVRNSRETDSFFKRFTAETYYKFLNILGGEIVYNHADYRLVSKRVIEALFMFNESNLFLRGMFPLIGYKNAVVEYKRNKRVGGNSHYSISKMFGLALNGITNLSIRPLRMILILGVILVTISFIGIVQAIIATLKGDIVFNLMSMTFTICFLSGVQLISLGIVGEYVGKVYIETKHRPKFIIEERV